MHFVKVPFALPVGPLFFDEADIPEPPVVGKTGSPFRPMSYWFPPCSIVRGIDADWLGSYIWLLARMEKWNCVRMMGMMIFRGRIIPNLTGRKRIYAMAEKTGAGLA